MSNKNNTEQKEEVIQLNIRLPESLYKLVQQFAEDTHRSKVGSGIHLLEMALKAEGYSK